MRFGQVLLQIQRKVPIPDDPAIGDAYGGGYYFGKINIDGLLYWLVVAEKSTESRMTVRSLATGTTGTDSTYNGMANTQAMTPDSAYAAAAYCRTYVDPAGNQDYYLASGYEMEILYRALKPTTGNNTTTQNSFNPNPYGSPSGPTYTATNPAQTAVSLFVGTGLTKQTLFNDGTARFWTSTQSPADATRNFTWRTDDGSTTAGSKTASNYVRPIRRILIPGQ
ncbi:hypothetical protein ACI2KS_10405 [Pseudomonas sp. NPDC087358]|uniref:hypothetical protein n=1 Tax=Pseudomonas sp. NPDC087358 TaxID=3364439 RepID=UPI00384B6C06